MQKSLPEREAFLRACFERHGVRIPAIVMLRQRTTVLLSLIIL